MKYLFLIAALILVFFSCRKDEIEPQPAPPEPPCDTTFIEIRNNDTIFPSEYLMTYPGSWWSYDNGTIEICFEWEEVPIYTRENNEEGCLVITSTYVYVPRTTSGHIHGDSKMENDHANYTTKFTRYVGEVGETYSTYEPSNHLYNYSVSTKLTVDSLISTMELGGVVYNNVLCTTTHIEFLSYKDPGANEEHYDYSFFAENIGLIHQESIPGFEFEPYEKSLDNYFISP